MFIVFSFIEGSGPAFGWTACVYHCGWGYVVKSMSPDKACLVALRSYVPADAKYPLPVRLVRAPLNLDAFSEREARDIVSDDSLHLCKTFRVFALDREQ